MCGMSANFAPDGCVVNLVMLGRNRLIFALVAGVLVLVGFPSQASAHRGHNHTASMRTERAIPASFGPVDASFRLARQSAIPILGKPAAPGSCTGCCYFGFGLSCCAAAALLVENQPLAVPDDVSGVLVISRLAFSGYHLPASSKPPRSRH